MSQKQPASSAASKRPAILSIAGFDPTGGAGIITDAAVFRALGFHPLTVLTSVAAQGASEVMQIRALPEVFIRRELQIVGREFHPVAVKIGMLYSEPAVMACADFLAEKQLPAVLDPLIWASSGRSLLRASAMRSLSQRLIPMCRLITPNLEEARYFLRMPILNLSEAAHAARWLARRWETWVLLKGGHLPGPPVDILTDGDQVRRYSHARIADGINLRGTGCALSAAAAVGLAQGKSVVEAVEFALEFLHKAIRNYYLAAQSKSVGYLHFPAKKAR